MEADDALLRIQIWPARPVVVVVVVVLHWEGRGQKDLMM